MKITLKEAVARKDLREFAKFPNDLYKSNDYFVPQIVSMDLDTFDPKKNAAFEVCEGKYWLALDESGKTVGRVAAIINHSYNEKTGKKYCRFGWIDFIESQEVVHALLDKVHQYAEQKGMEEIVGPMGFLEFDVMGVLVEGFDQIPTAYGKYNAPYYERLIMNEGYVPDHDYVEYRVTVPDDISRYVRMSEIVAQRTGLHEGNYSSMKELMDKYIDGVFSVLNKTYSVLNGFSELTKGQCDDLVRHFVPNLSLEYISVIVNDDDEVVGFGVCMPSMARALQKAKGSLFPFGWYHILKALRKNDILDTLLIAIDNDYKERGVTAMIMAKIGKAIMKNGIKYIETTRELEDNRSVQNLWGRFERRLHKRARVYSKRV